MKLKLRYTCIPACISFGPIFMTGMTFDGWEFAIRLGGAVMVIAGLSLMLDIIMSQQQAIDTLLSAGKTKPDSLRTHRA